MAHHLMLVPSLACPAGCKYCFGPHEGKQTMNGDILNAVVQWQKSLNNDDSLEITFHGGEPLVPGAAFYREALPLLRDGLAPRKVRFAMQSNLWLLDDELCELFREHKLAIGTSLDGPEPINDTQRGEGYFKQTWAGIELAHKHGLHPGCICTFTAQSLKRVTEVFDFFLREGLDFSVHSALPSLRYPNLDNWALSAAEHGNLLIKILDLYLANIDKIRVSTLDSMIGSVSAGKGGICTFGDCLGNYLAIGPDGNIYPCQRYTGMPEYIIANVLDCPTQAEMEATRVWRMFRERQEQVKEKCGDCTHFEYCRGGCPYNELVQNNGKFENGRDPDCRAYQRTFGTILDRATAEVFSSENLEMVVQNPNPDAGLLRRGKLISIMRGGPHPYEIAGHARRIVTAVALAATNSPAETMSRLKQFKAFVRLNHTAITNLYQHLTTPAKGLNNLYLHTTFNCNLKCSHCYAEAKPGIKESMAVVDLERACREAAGLGFRHVVITGGEPLVHPDKTALLNTLAQLRRDLKPLITVLRTNLTQEFGREMLERISRSTDQVVVSIDGDRETHDARRGNGSYDLAVKNLCALREIGGDSDISLATVLPLEQLNGAPGAAVKALAHELGIKRTRFKPLLPLGRAFTAEPDIVPETLWGHLDPEEIISYGFTPSASCGIGQNLYVEPDGSAYPCYAWCKKDWGLGLINGPGGLKSLIESAAFCDLGRHTVNTNQLCRRCSLRFLCGGACRAWNRLKQDRNAFNETASDLDEPPLDCSVLHKRVRSLLLSALKHLEISEREWLHSGLPIPDQPPM